jgi:epoxyqueuosine reductase
MAATRVAVIEQARALGFNMVGVAPATPARRLDAYLDWIARQYHGEMGYMARPDRQARRRDLAVILPGVRSLICVGLDYQTLAPPPDFAADPARGRISNYAWGLDYHDLMAPRLEALAERLRFLLGAEVRSRVYVDTGAILERDHAERAGFGFIGKNTMLIAPRRGSWFFLGELLTTAAIEPDPLPATMPTCGQCQRCLLACPTAAFPKPYVLDARRCISYLTIELKGPIPVELRPLMRNWIYGCDVCQAVCPFNRFAPEATETGFAPSSWEAAAPPLLELLTLDREGFSRRYAGSPVKRVKWDRFMRNVCVAAGNWRDPAAMPPLAALLRDPSSLVRGHAAWALGRIGRPHQAAGDGAAAAALAAALSEETDVRVRGELRQALDLVRKTP